MYTLEIIDTKGKVSRRYKGEPMILFNKDTETTITLGIRGMVALVHWIKNGSPEIEYYVGILV